MAGIIDIGLCGTQSYGLDDLKESYVRFLEKHKDRIGKENGYSFFSMIEGDNYRKNELNGKTTKIMFVGRSTNGWKFDFGGKDFRESVDKMWDDRGKILKDIQKGKINNNTTEDTSEEDKEKKSNEKYNYNTSPFFQLCREIMKLYGTDCENWPQYMLWTNLYKLAPYEAGNPGRRIIAETIDECAELLDNEIKYAHPDVIIFITGAWWYMPFDIRTGVNRRAFANTVGVNIPNDESQIIIGSGISRNYRWHPKVIVTHRPESAGKNRAEHAKMIFDRLMEMDAETEH